MIPWALQSRGLTGAEPGAPNAPLVPAGCWAACSGLVCKPQGSRSAKTWGCWGGTGEAGKTAMETCAAHSASGDVCILSFRVGFALSKLSGLGLRLWRRM